MASPADSRPLLRFDRFELDLRTGEIYKEGRRVKLQEQPFRVLALLVGRPGELVTREELRKRLWPNDTFVDFDHGVNIAINKLRDALADSPEKPRFIETLPRKGYRFIAAVQSASSAPHQELIAQTERAAKQAVKVFAVRRSLKFWIAAGLLAATLVLFIGLNIGAVRQRFLPASPTMKVQSIAVLPLQNIGGDTAQEYWVDGMTDALIAELGQIREIRVISRTSVMRYKGTSKSVQDIAHELGVDAVVEGTIERSGDRVRVSARLVQASPEKNLWGASIEKTFSDVLELQDEVARAIANGIQIKLTPQEQTRLARSNTVDPQAYEAYLQGRYFWNKRTEGGMKTAISFFQNSLDNDPKSPLAYDGLADCWLSLGWYGYLPPEESFLKAKDAAQRALALDPTLGEAHTSLAFARMNYDWDWSSAEREFRKAIDLNPNYANAHHWYADYLSAVGRHNEAIIESKRALELDPVSPIINAWLGWRYFFARQYDLAIEQYIKTLEMDPTFAPAHFVLGQAYEQKFMPEKAIVDLKKAVELERSSLYLSALAHAYGIAGRHVEAEKLLREMKERAQHDYVPSFDIAIIYAGLGQKDQALRSLEKGYEEHSAWMVWLRVDPRLDVLRADPRFQNLLHRIGLL